MALLNSKQFAVPTNITGSFTGSFTGDGSGLENIPASGITGLNLSQIASGSATASISPDSGFRVNTDSHFTGSIEVQGDVTIHGTASVDVLITNYESSSIIYSSGSTKFGDTSDDTHQFTGSIQQSGADSYFLNNVGIGTTSPATELHVTGDFLSGTSTSTGLWFDPGTNRLSLGGQRVIEKSGASIYLGYNTTSLIFRTNNLERARFDVDGNFGIGTTSPAYKLDVSGSGRFYDLRVEPVGSIDFSNSAISSQWSFIKSQDGNKLHLSSSFWINLTSDSTTTISTPKLLITGAANNNSTGIVFKRSSTPETNDTTFHIGQGFGERIGISGRARDTAQFFVNRIITGATGNLINLTNQDQADL